MTSRKVRRFKGVGQDGRVWVIKAKDLEEAQKVGRYVGEGLGGPLRIEEEQGATSGNKTSM